MDCYLCDQEATQRCSRCGNPYCSDHGEDPSADSLTGQTGRALCADCLSPVSAAPSGTLFRLSLLALLGGSVLALWLLVRPPGLPGESSEIVLPEASPASSPEPITPSPIPTTETPVAEPTAKPTPKPTKKPTATPEPTEEPGFIEYVIVEGDTLFDIAAAYGIDYFDLLAYNGLTEEDAPFIQPGDVIIIPQ